MSKVHQAGTLDGQSPPAILPRLKRMGWGWSQKWRWSHLLAFQRVSSSSSAWIRKIAFWMALAPAPVKAAEACWGSPSTCTWNHIGPTWARISMGSSGSGMKAASAR